MPSGDSIQSANFAVLILFYLGNFTGFILIPFVMFARIFYFCHYIMDTVIGVLIGLSVSWILVYPLRLITIVYFKNYSFFYFIFFVYLFYF